MVERSLSMWEVPGSIPGFSKTFRNWASATRFESHLDHHSVKAFMSELQIWTISPYSARLLVTSGLFQCNLVKSLELARIRTWNLLIRSQTRYPLRHKSRWVYMGVRARQYLHFKIDISFQQHSLGLFKIGKFSRWPSYFVLETQTSLTALQMSRGTSSNGRALA